MNGEIIFGNRNFIIPMLLFIAEGIQYHDKGVKRDADADWREGHRGDR